MQFTPLETALISFVCAILAGLFVRSKCVSKSECKEYRETFGSHCQGVHEDIDNKFKVRFDKIDRSLDTLFRMVRPVVVHLPIAEDKKAAILNQKGDD